MAPGAAPKPGRSLPQAVPASRVFPDADPAYDETSVASAADLAAKYGLDWMRRALPGRVRCGPHPLFAVTVRHVDGSMSLVRAGDMSPLKAGCQLYSGGEARLLGLHNQVPPGLHYHAASMQDFGTADPSFVTVHFASPGRLYVLLGEETVEPRWLRELFFKLREPVYGGRVRLPVRWRLGGLMSVIHAIASSQRPRGQQQQMLVFKSKRVYRCGDMVRLGGLPTAHVTDGVYVVAAACESLNCEGGRVCAPLPSSNVADWAVWHSRMIKAIRRSRVDDVKSLLQADAWVHRPFRADPLSWLPPDEPGPSPLTSDLAAATHNVELLALLVAECHCQLSMKGLRLMVRRWEEVTASCGGPVEVLIGVVRRCARPLSTVACVLTALRYEVDVRERARNRSTLELRAALRKFQDLQTALLDAVGDTARRGQPDAASSPGAPAPSMSLAWLQGVLDPRAATGPVALADHSPLRIAFEDRDYGFAASAVMEAYVREQWLGAALLAMTPRDGTREMTVLDPLVLHTAMARSGLVAPEGVVSVCVEGALRGWYLVCVVPAPFINSPRGRWCMQIMSGIAFILAYNIALGGDYKLLSTRLTLAGILCIFLLGYLVETFEIIMVAYGGSVSRYFKRNPQELVFLLCDSLLLGLSVLHMLYISDLTNLSPMTYMRLLMIWSALAVIVYVKLLYTLIPLVQRLGPLLNTVTNMMSELFVFLLPFIVITCGFATALCVVFRGQAVDTGTNTFPESFLMLFQAFLGSFDLTIWDGVIPPMRIYGISVTVIYLVIAGILLANLLIAIISYKYRPEEVAAQSVFGLAEVVDRHQMQVDGALLCSPFCLLQIPVNLLPAGTRPAILPYTLLRMGIPPIEGFRPAAPHLNTVATGRAAVPQLLFHLTLHPLILLAVNVAYYALSPLCLLYFTLHGHNRIFDRVSERLASAPAAPDVKGLAGVPVPSERRRQKAAGAGSEAEGGEDGQEDHAADGETEPGGAPSGRGSSAAPSGGRSADSFGNDAPPAPGAEHTGGDPWKDVIRHCTLQGLLLLLRAAVRMVVAFFCGIFLVYGMIGALLVTFGGIWIWCWCVLLSTYSVLYEPVARIGRALRSASSHKHGRNAVAAGPEGPHDMGPGDGAQRPGIGRWTGGAGAGGGVGGARPRSAAGASRTKLTSMQVEQRWREVEREAATRRKAMCARYLSRAQVDDAIVRVFALDGLASALGGLGGAGGGVLPPGVVEGITFDGAGQGGVLGAGRASRPSTAVSRLRARQATRRASAAASEAAARLEGPDAVGFEAGGGVGRKTVRHRDPGPGAEAGRASQPHSAAARNRAGLAAAREAASQSLQPLPEHGDASTGDRAAADAGPTAAVPAGGDGAVGAALAAAGSAGQWQPLVAALAAPLADQVQQVTRAMNERMEAQEVELREARGELAELRDLLGLALGRLQEADGAAERRRIVLGAAYGNENY
ncbi:hypothetical protein HYH03_003010 [Edaphochlamys debaryana]|uniref:Ion transport domain-containing protein n=1 Tax=Edaphochlamys debaryana TaxID=47281 RepID=A0A835YC40_9CHLO|nr:hypothetical protein HYH03_003010 [Edaphochlamys debaryana]|eukprot:KAG2498817.1 hypothetical protein HYH03_003010 [Edaphochlamys debaryana]